MVAHRHDNSGFLRHSRHSPSAVAIVVALHAAAITAAFLVKSGVVPIEGTGIIEIINVPQEPPPDPIPEPPQTELPPPIPATSEVPPISLPPDRPFRIAEPRLPEDWTLPPPPPEPVVVEARLHGTDLQPRYPPSLLRQEIEGSCTVRVHVAANGRVNAAEPVRSTHAAFCDATTAHALRRWRFEPATRDGRPVDSWQQHTVVFQLTG